MTASVNEIPKVMKRKIKELSINQTYLAMDLGVVDSRVSHWITGKYVPSTDYVVKICKALKVSPNELLGWKE